MLNVPAEVVYEIIHASLVRRGGRLFISEQELEEKTKSLCSMFIDQKTPLPIVKLYAKELDVWQELGLRGKLPESVPEMMLLRLDQLTARSRGSAAEGQILQAIVKGIAWECVREKLRPIPITIAEAESVVRRHLRRPRRYVPDLIELGILQDAGSDRGSNHAPHSMRISGSNARH